MSAFKLIIGIVFVILVAMFTVLNDSTVEVHYYDLYLHVQTISLTMVELVLGSFIMGFLLAILFTAFGSIRMKSQVRRKSKEVVSLQRDIDRLKPSSVSGN